MVKKKISELPVAATVTGVEVLPVVQNGNTVRTTVSGLTSDLNVALMKRQRVIDISDTTYGGILGDNTGNDGPSIQNALNDWATNGGILTGPAAAFCRVTQGLVLPAGTAERVYAINGAGLTILGVGAIDILADTVPANTATASARTNRKFVIEDLRIIGDQVTAGQKGLVLRGTSRAELGGLDIQYCDTNYDLVFALNGHLTDCFEKLGRSYGFRVRSGVGVWGDATHPNSASNITMLENCRSYGAPAAIAGFYLFGSNEVQLNNCTTEGFGHTDPIVIDNGGSGNANVCIVRNHHFENVPVNSHVKLLGNAMTVTFEACGWTQGAIMVDALTAMNHQINFVRCPRLFGKFRAADAGGTQVTNNSWTFEGCGTLGTDPLAPGFWDNAAVPPYAVSSGTLPAGYVSGASGNYPSVRIGDRLIERFRQRFFVSTQTTTNISAWFRAVINFGLKPGQPADELDVNSWLLWADEVNGNLVLWHKDSAGVLRAIRFNYTSGATAALSSSLVERNTQTGSYTTVLTDAGKVVEMNVASANTLTIPPNSSVAYPIGTVIEAYQVGAGQTTLTPGSGVTLTQRESKLKLAGVGASASLRKRATNEWVVSGDLSA